MDTLFGYCGLSCTGCPIYVATLEGNATRKLQMRKTIASTLRERYCLNLKVEEINDCDGCRSERLFVTCASCDIRKCAREKNLTSCAFCELFPCGSLQSIHSEDPMARERLDALRGIKNTHK